MVSSLVGSIPPIMAIFLIASICITIRYVEHLCKTFPSLLAANQLPKLGVTYTRAPQIYQKQNRLDDSPWRKSSIASRNVVSHSQTRFHERYLRVRHGSILCEYACPVGCKKSCRTSALFKLKSFPRTSMVLMFPPLDIIQTCPGVRRWYTNLLLLRKHAKRRSRMWESLASTRFFRSGIY